jgi:hypothetical protein
LVTDTLELLIDVQLARVEVDAVPGQTEDFTPAQAQDEDQDVSRVKCLLVTAGRLQELAGFIDAPGAALLAADAGHPDHGGRVAGDHLVFDGAAERGPQRVAGILAASGGQDLVAAQLYATLTLEEAVRDVTAELAHLTKAVVTASRRR